MKVVITGGHHNSALIIAEALRAQGYSILWLGSRRTMIGDAHNSLEYQEVTAAGFPFINLLAGKFHSRAHPIHLLRIPLGFIQAFSILVRAKPGLILAFGSYVAVPVALAGKALRIPIIAFEQTTSIGRANQLIGKISRKNFLTWKSSQKLFPPNNTQVVGLPLRSQIWQKNSEKIFSEKLPTLLITGGKQGAHVINLAIFKLLPSLLQHFNVIHQTGASRKTQDHQKALKQKRTMSPKLALRYQVEAHMSWQKMIAALQESDLVVSRSGAHITYELLALGKPAILVPLPFSYRNEQHQNAQKLSKAGLVEILPQKKLTPKNVLTKIRRLEKHLNHYNQKGSEAKKLIETDATKKIIAFILNHYPHASKKP